MPTARQRWRSTENKANCSATIGDAVGHLLLTVQDVLQRRWTKAALGIVGPSMSLVVHHNGYSDMSHPYRRTIGVRLSSNPGSLHHPMSHGKSQAPPQLDHPSSYLPLCKLW